MTRSKPLAFVGGADPGYLVDDDDGAAMVARAMVCATGPATLAARARVLELGHTVVGADSPPAPPHRTS